MLRLPLLTAAVLTLSAALAVHAQAPAKPAAAPAAATAAATAPATAPAVAPAAAAAVKAAPAAMATAAAGDATEGKLAYYGKRFAGRKTASGERFNPDALTMAHKSLPFGTRVKVTNLANKRSVVVRVNDRGPSTPDRVGDLSLAAARKLGAIKPGTINAKMEVVGMAKGRSKKAAAKKT